MMTEQKYFEKEIVTYCMIYSCEDCPKYGDDCDGREEE